MFVNQKILRVVSVIGAILIGHGAMPALAQTGEANEALTQMITNLDAKVFGAYNRCDLEVFSSYFTPTVEFYHDQGGASFDRATVVANAKKFICGKVRRKLLPATLKVYPIKGYGAIEEGEHVFCQIESGKCEGVAKFNMIWENDNGDWKLTRVVSYGHRPFSDEEFPLGQSIEGK